MKTVDLKNKHFTCRLAPAMGGAIYSFDYHAGQVTQPLLRDTATTEAKQILDFASWPLVPFSNRIKGGRFVFGGESYTVPTNYLGDHIHASHGHGWEHAWTVTRHDATHCDMVFAFNDRAVWPFPYRAEQKFGLRDDGLDLSLCVTNTGDKSMPAGLGIHPYFPRTDATTLRAVVGHLWEIDEFIIPSRRLPPPAQYQFAEAKTLKTARLDHCFDGYGGVAEIVWPDQPMKLTITSSDNLRHFVVYTPQGKDFFCAEPVSHMPDAVNRMDEGETGLIVLRPGETMTVSYRFMASKLAP